MPVFDSTLIGGREKKCTTLSSELLQIGEEVAGFFHIRSNAKDRATGFVQQFHYKGCRRPEKPVESYVLLSVEGFHQSLHTIVPAKEGKNIDWLGRFDHETKISGLYQLF